VTIVRDLFRPYENPVLFLWEEDAERTHLTPAGFCVAVISVVALILATVVSLKIVGIAKKPSNAGGASSTTSLVYWSRFATVVMFDAAL
jgi:hypothetical protein